MSETAPPRAEGVSRSRSLEPKWAIAALPWLWFLVRSFHPLLDYLAIGLPVLTMIAFGVAIVWSIAKRSGLALLTAVSLIAFFVVAVIAPMRPTSAATPANTTRLATMNLGLQWFSDNDAGFFVFTEKPDVLVGLELSESHHAEFESRFAFNHSDILSLPEQQANEAGLEPEGDGFRRNGLPSIGVYSNVPMTLLDDPLAGVIEDGLPGFRIRVEDENQPFTLYALHIPRPFPGNGTYELGVSEHVELVRAIRDAVEAEEGPVVVAGDLNAVDRGISYRTLTGSLNDGMRQSGWAVPTADRPLPWSLLFARLDHILVSEDVCVTNGASRDTRYADHRPLVADIGLCP